VVVEEVVEEEAERVRRYFLPTVATLGHSCSERTPFFVQQGLWWWRVWALRLEQDGLTGWRR